MNSATTLITSHNTEGNEAHCGYFDALGQGNGLSRDRLIPQVTAGLAYKTATHRLDGSRPASGTVIFSPEQPCPRSNHGWMGAGQH
jgi:hypothetical protein